MFLFPVQVNPTEFVLMIALEDENLARMKEYDPAEIAVAKMGKPWDDLKLRAISVYYVTEADMKRVIKLASEGKQREAIQYLQRGFRFQPEAGDHDGPYLSAKTKGGTKQ